ncbi:MAG: secretin N-terminal domain-containing protein [Nevskia sp.]|nr:secretin N-terminal domain-containing protein [Nevskia sp.]
MSLEQVTLGAFIDEVYSKALKLSVQVDPAVATRRELVTLRTGKPLPADELFDMAHKVLASYGIGVNWDGSVLHVVPDDALLAQVPEIVSGRALPELPVALRPIFQVIELHQVASGDMLGWLTDAYGTKLKLFQSPATNAIMLLGLPENVAAGVEAVRILDQARMAGLRNLRVTPIYWTAVNLASKLVTVLKAEGYDASATVDRAASITIVPIEANNSVIVFASDATVLDHVQQWIVDLDQPAKVNPLDSIFVYQVQNTTAASLGQILHSVLGGTGAVSGNRPEAQLEQAGQTRTAGGIGGIGSAGQAQPAAGQSSTSSASGLEGGTRLVVDYERNALIIIGPAQEYERIRPLLNTLDKPPREALIEVTVVELTLNDSANLGIEWAAITGGLYGVGTAPIPQAGGGGLSIGTSGFNYALLNGAGQVRAALNAMAQTSRVKVLSTPRVLAQSGGKASIDVGTEVPIVTSQATTNQATTGGNTGILQSIDYQKTGVLLSVSPVVHSGDRVDLNINQEVSQALPNTTSSISSPLIQNRNITTELSVHDGQTVVIGGLISENRTSGNTGVPFLKDIPVLGNLFRTQNVATNRTELLVFITPYVISTDMDADAITKQFQDQMGRWATPSSQLSW